MLGIGSINVHRQTYFAVKKGMNYFLTIGKHTRRMLLDEIDDVQRIGYFVVSWGWSCSAVAMAMAMAFCIHGQPCKTSNNQ